MGMLDLMKYKRKNLDITWYKIREYVINKYPASGTVTGLLEIIVKEGADVVIVIPVEVLKPIPTTLLIAELLLSPAKLFTSSSLNNCSPFLAII